MTPTKKRRNKSYGTETQYSLQGECKFFRKKTTHVFSDFADTNAVKIKCGSVTLRQTVPVLHSMYIAHMTLSAKYIIIKSCFYFILCHQFITIVDTILMLFCVTYSMFSARKMRKKTHLN